MLKLALVVGLGAAAWYWRKDIAAMMDKEFPGLRERAGRTLDDASESAEKFYGQAKSRMGSA